ncbi:MAG: FAD-binding oxidoreductase [Stagnimonas sp.]|nr:FAD-binding oxidoreductase [Stagnimonas sp.]
MSRIELLTGIVAVLALQLLALLGLALYRFRRDRQTRGPEPAWPGARRFRVRRRAPENGDGSIVSFELEPVDGQPLPAFLPGQFLGFELPLPGGAGQAASTEIRCYSLSDRPDPDHYRVTIRRVVGGRGSGYFHDQVQVGTVLSVRAPSGRFRLGPDDGRPLVLIGGGIGITPMLSMLASRLRQPLRQDLWLFYGTRDATDQIMGSWLDAAARQHPQLHLQLCHSRPAGNERLGLDYQHAGHVDLPLLRRVLPSPHCHFHVCGPRAMLESLVPALRDWGVPEADIHYEAFGPASLAPGQPHEAGEDVAWQVRFTRSGRTLSWTQRRGSLLELAEAAGLVIDSGCRAGSCGSCRTGIESGAVRYRQAPGFDCGAGHCLPCVCVPASDLALSA